MPNLNDPWTAAMLSGDFESAWSICDRVLAERVAKNEDCGEWPRHEQFIWRGQQLANRRVLVRCYHGLGDTLQFIRFAAPLRQIAREVTVWVQPELLSLVATAPGVDRVSALHDGRPEFLYDVDIEIMELPHALRVSLASVGAHVPYLFPRMTSRVPESGRGHLKVGIAWRSGNWSRERCVPVEMLRRLHEVDGIQLYSLQYPGDAAELEAIGAADLACKEIELLASRMRRLDLIVSVDTFIAHLAGAMGLPTWTLLPVDTDWRWMQNRSDSPWYPTMQLFRQTRSGDWLDPIEDVVTRLQEHALIHHGSALRLPLGAATGLTNR